MEFDEMKRGNGAVDRLREAASGIQAPKDYFGGVSGPKPPSVDRVLLFARTGPHWSRGEPSLHHRFLVVFALAGEGQVFVDGEGSRLVPGSAVLVLPHQLHHYRIDAGDELRWIFLTFESAEDPFWQAWAGRTISCGEESFRSLEELVRSFREGTASEEGVAHASILLSLLWLDARKSKGTERSFRGQEVSLRSRGTAPKGIADSAGREEPSHRDPVLSRVLSELRRNPGKGWTVEALAEASGLSRSGLARRFQAALGLSLGRYLRESRVRKASSLLLGTGRNVGEIAEETGFSSLYAFSRTFKEVTGHAPRDFRRLFGATSSAVKKKP